MDHHPLILIVEDDDEIRTLVCEYLSSSGFDCLTAASGPDMDHVLASTDPSLIILDLMLPYGEDGLAICRRLRAASSVPILILTARGDEIDRIVGMELGADDYMAKPFSPRELLARIRAILRRSSSSDPRRPNEVRCAHLIINYDRRDVRTLKGTPIALSSGEFTLLTVFLSRPQRVLDRDRLLELVSGRSLGGVFDRSIDVQISRLRRKIEQDPSNPSLIKTIRNGGYILAEHVNT